MQSDDLEKEKGLNPYISIIGTLALALGTIFGFGSLVATSNTYLLQAGPAGTIFGICLGAIVMLIIAKNYDYLMSKYREIGERITREPHRGCTIVDAQGFYSGKEVKMLFVLAKRRQSNLIFRIINEVDPTAFVSQSAVIGVYGEGFDHFKVRMKKPGTKHETD